jgi:hypothetical protein
MGDVEDIMQNLLEPESEIKRKAFIRELARAVASEIPRDCHLGLDAAEIADMRALAACYSRGKVAAVRFIITLVFASLIGGIAVVIDKIGISWLMK